MPINGTSPPPTDVILGCSGCGATLPDDAQFCSKCGKAVSSPPKQAPKTLPAATVKTKGMARRKRRALVFWIIFGLLLLLLVWMAISDNPFAQQIQELVGLKHDETIVETETPFLVVAHSFRYYKFALPEGSMNVAIVGQFAASEQAGKVAKQSAQGKPQAADNDIEVYVLSEPAFAVWQNGYATSSVYESGRVSDGKVQADAPAGAGIYYLVFNNRFDPKIAKNVTATVLLRYKSWLPGWFRRIKGRVINWFGI
jgi:predicted nucleic acid-binding Zn ribbon protein